MAAFRVLHPHRLNLVAAMMPQDVSNQSLLFDRQITEPAASSATTNHAPPAAAATSLTPQQKPLMLSGGITKTAHLQIASKVQQPQLLALELRSA